MQTANVEATLCSGRAEAEFSNTFQTVTPLESLFFPHFQCIANVDVGREKKSKPRLSGFPPQDRRVF